MCHWSMKTWTENIPKKKLFVKILKIWVFSSFLKDNQNIFRERPGFAGSLPSVRVTQTYANVTHNADSGSYVDQIVSNPSGCLVQWHQWYFNANIKSDELCSDDRISSEVSQKNTRFLHFLFSEKIFKVARPNCVLY